MSGSKRLPCQKEACAIQKCLQEYSYQEDRCQDVIEAMKKCCFRNSAINTDLCLGFKKEFEQWKVANSEK
ncbi:Cx9C motif-containing protein 4, mitochondrial [Desmophyllum pertusum]|uniref:Cx9C motif-containing protein 4, mitochondrial n=1 Tax=Desmophyllum pertusum TaxID=174260 RepID=A0A9X0CFN4_9CNID|nr:Cx9C motif-containing protein 4, mitochondrial [Desmophyllum pertusum]